MVWLKANSPLHATPRPQVWPPQGASFDAADAFGPDLSDTQHEQEASATQDLPVSAQEAANHKTQPSVVRGYHVYSHVAGFFVSGGYYGLVQPQGSVLAFVQQYGGGFLRRSFERGHCQIRQARDHEQSLSCIAAQYPAGQWIRAASSPALSGHRR